MRYPLPPQAKLTLKLDCPMFRLNEHQVRLRFSTYHLIDGTELHDWYSYDTCYTKGTIQLDGKTFSFQIQQGNTIETDYPDGNQKILGGRHTDNPAAGL